MPKETETPINPERQHDQNKIAFTWQKALQQSEQQQVNRETSLWGKLVDKVARFIAGPEEK